MRQRVFSRLGRAQLAKSLALVFGLILLEVPRLWSAENFRVGYPSLATGFAALPRIS